MKTINQYIQEKLVLNKGLVNSNNLFIEIYNDYIERGNKFSIIPVEKRIEQLERLNLNSDDVSMKFGPNHFSLYGLNDLLLLRVDFPTKTNNEGLYIKFTDTIKEALKLRKSWSDFVKLFGFNSIFEYNEWKKNLIEDLSMETNKNISSEPGLHYIIRLNKNV
jgi:hypothetical protein